jgi:serine O-acetyltransferase
MAVPQMELFIVRARSCNVDMFENVRADIRRLTEQEPTLGLKLGVVFFNLGLHAVFLYRLSRWLYLHHLGPLAVVVTYLNSVFTGAQISRGAAIGKGLVMYHPQGTVVGPTVIGEHCTLMQSNVIGQLQGGGDRPIIGDHFYAGAGAKMLGKIQIGNHVRVGSNSVVTKSLPDGVTAVGIPAKIIYRRELSGEGGQDAAAPAAD